MRDLILTNLYPPAHLGGMELRCQEVVEGLRARGHDCLVMTSTFVPPGAQVTEVAGIRRALSLDADVYHYRPVDHLLRQPRRLRANLRALQATIDSFRPDLVFVWGMWHLSPALAAAAEERMPGRVAYSFAGYWPVEPDAHEQYWLGQADNLAARVACRLLAPLALSRRYQPVRSDALDFEQAIACSAFVLDQLRQAGLTPSHAQVVYSGIDTEHFVPAPERQPTGGLEVVHVGGAVPHKGASTAIEALRQIVVQGECSIRLTIVGGGHPEHCAQLEDVVRGAGLGEWVRFRPPLPRDEMPALLQTFDALVLPTYTEEPLSRAVMEGMACGLAVIASNTGGTPEMITHGQDGLLFEPTDSETLAHSLRELADDPVLRQRLGRSARQTAERRFDKERMIDEIEGFLLAVYTQQGNQA